MKTDTYTKSLLTVIAVCLVTLTLKQIDLFPEVKAEKNRVDAIERKVNYGLVPLDKNGAVKVRFTEPEMMDINIEKVGGNSVFGGNFPVSIEDIRDQPIEVEQR